MIPSQIKVKPKSQCLALTYADAQFELSYEFYGCIRPRPKCAGTVAAPACCNTAKDVVLLRIIPTGNYALQLVFDDGHDSGLYDWNYLRYLCDHHEALWQAYLARLEQAGKTRESPVIHFKSFIKGASCDGRQQGFKSNPIIDPNAASEAQNTKPRGQP